MGSPKGPRAGLLTNLKP